MKAAAVACTLALTFLVWTGSLGGCSSHSSGVTALKVIMPGAWSTADNANVCPGGLWTRVTEQTQTGFGAVGSTKGRPFNKQLFFCCPRRGQGPVCRRAVWIDRTTSTPVLVPKRTGHGGHIR